MLVGVLVGGGVTEGVAVDVIRTVSVGVRDGVIVWIGISGGKGVLVIVGVSEGTNGGVGDRIAGRGEGETTAVMMGGRG